MDPGDVAAVDAVPDLQYVDTGMYDTAEYGAVYVLDAGRPAVVDTGIGTNVERVVDAVEAAGVGREELAAIVPTHVHLDHAGGAGFLAERFPDAAVYVHEAGARHLVDPTRLWEGTKRAVGDQLQFYVEPEPVPEARVHSLADGDVVDLGDRELVAHHAPGHAPHQAVFELPSADAVFTADAAGIYVPALDAVEPTTPPPDFDLETCLDDVDTLASLDPDTLLYPHFGPVDAAGRLAEYRDVLTDWVERVERARAGHPTDEDAVTALVEERLAREDLRAAWGETKLRGETAMNVRGVLRYLDGR
jgi:glyoxylase-like metal-dependent hydrolase (beta-lactamase superfamily II)